MNENQSKGRDRSPRLGLAGMFAIVERQDLSAIIALMAGEQSMVVPRN